MRHVILDSIGSEAILSVFGLDLVYVIDSTEEQFDVTVELLLYEVKLIYLRLNLILLNRCLVVVHDVVPLAVMHNRLDVQARLFLCNLW